MTNWRAYLWPIVILPGTALCQTRVYDIVTDFSLTSNPNGVWSYLSYSYGNFTQKFGSVPNLGCPGVQGWQWSPVLESGAPYVMRNVSGASFQCGSVWVPTDTLNLHPGKYGETAVVRWTAPRSGFMTISGRFQANDSTTTDVSVRWNGSTWVAGALNGSGTTVPISLGPLYIPAGDSVDFVVGYGSDGYYYYDSTGLAATITLDGVDVAVNSLSASPLPAQPGVTLHYSGYFSNNGSAATVATGVALTATLSGGLSLVSARTNYGSCSGTGPITCSIGTLYAGNYGYFDIYTVPDGSGPVSLAVNIQANEPDYNSGNHSRSVSYSVGPATKSSAAPGDLLVSNYDTNSLSLFDGKSGAFADTLVPSGSGGLSSVPDFAYGRDGNLYVASFGTNSILRYDRLTGAFLGTLIGPGSGLSQPVRLSFDSDGRLYVGINTGQILRYDGSTGAPMGVFATTTAGSITDLIFGPDGNLYVAQSNGSVLRFNGQTGASMGAFVSAGAGGMTNATALRFMPDGNLLVAAFYENAIFKYDGTNGAFLGVFASGNGLYNPWSMAFGPNGNLYVSSGGSSILRVDGSTGAFLGSRRVCALRHRRNAPRPYDRIRAGGR